MSQSDQFAASQVLEALYALAAQPESWAELLEVLGAPGAGGEAPPLVAQLAQGAERIAERSRPADPSAPGSLPDEAAVLVLSLSGRVLSANRQGRAMQPLLGVIVGRGGPVLTHEANLEVLAMARRRGFGAETPPVLARIWLTQDPDTAFVYLTPTAALPDRLKLNLSPWQEEPGAIAVVCPPGDGDRAFWQSVRAGFGLTPAELRLAERLKDGMSLKEAAETLGLSVNTLRNQLNAIFEKLGVHRQSEVIRSLTQMASVYPHQPRPPARVAAQAEWNLDPDDRPPRQYLTLRDGRRLAYREYGVADGRPVVFCHGGLGASLLPAGVSRLCHRYRLRALCPDRPGIGHSDPRAGDPLAGSAQDMAAFFDGLDLPPLQLCAFTSGARFALAAAALLGPRVTRVLMLSPRLPHAAEASFSPSPMVKFQQRISNSLWLTESVMAVMRLRLTRPIMEQIVRGSAVSPGDSGHLAANPHLIDALFAGMQETWIRGAAGAAGEIRCLRSQAPPDFAAISARLEVWHGAQDSYASAEAVAAYYQIAPDALRIVPDIGNYLIHKHWTEILMTLASANLSPWDTLTPEIMV